MPQELRPTDSRSKYGIRLMPIADGMLFDRRFAIDPQFGGEEKGVTGPTGTRASDLNMDVANHLARLLRISGAQVVLTRESDQTVSALRRVEIAERFGAEWFISIGHGSAAQAEIMETESASEISVTKQAEVLHYPKSQPGNKLAASIAEMLKRRRIAENVSLEPATTFVLTHTSSPAVMITGPDPSIPEIEEEYRYPGTARNEAYSIYCGILEDFGLHEKNTGQISIKVSDNEGTAISKIVLSLDNVFTLQTDARGEASFQGLTSGKHALEVFLGGRLIWSGKIMTEAGRNVSINILVSGSTVVSKSAAM
jgi:hypothetical protein